MKRFLLENSRCPLVWCIWKCPFGCLSGSILGEFVWNCHNLRECIWLWPVLSTLSILKCLYCISIIQIYVYIYNYMRKHSQHNIRSSMDERTHFFIKLYLSHFIRKGWCWLCVRGGLETETDCYILTQSSSREHSNTSSSSWMGCSTVCRWGPKPSVWSWFSLREHPITNCDWNWTGTDWLTGTD